MSPPPKPASEPSERLGAEARSDPLGRARILTEGGVQEYRLSPPMKPRHLKGDSYRLKDRDLGRCLLTTTERDDGPAQGVNF